MLRKVLQALGLSAQAYVLFKPTQLTAHVHTSHALPLLTALALEDLQDADQAAGLRQELRQLASMLLGTAPQGSATQARGLCCEPAQGRMAPALHALAVQEAGLYRITADSQQFGSELLFHPLCFVAQSSKYTGCQTHHLEVKCSSEQTSCR